MNKTSSTQSQPAAPSSTGPLPRLLYSREEAAYMLSMSVRSLDYYISQKLLTTRRKGRKVLIPHGELSRFARIDNTADIRQ